MDAELKATASLSGRRIDLVWTWRTFEGEPGAGKRFRLIRRTRRYPVKPEDRDTKDPLLEVHIPGTDAIVHKVDDPDTGEVVFTIKYVDHNLDEGIYYYAMFAGEDNVFEEAGRASATATGEYCSGEKLYALLPEVYRGYDEPLPPDSGKGDLRRFLALFGLGLDFVRSRAEGLRGRHDVLNARADFLPHLARWIGWDLDLTQDEISQRMDILFAPLLYKTVGTLPNLRALVNRVTGWNCRIKEYVHNVFLTNAPETLHLWDIWESSYDPAGQQWFEPAQLTLCEDYDGRPACVKDSGGVARLFWHSRRGDNRDIWCQRPGDSGSVSLRLDMRPRDNTLTSLQHTGSPSVISVGDNLQLFFEADHPENGNTCIWLSELSPASLDAKPDAGLQKCAADDLSGHKRADERNPCAVQFNGKTWVFWQSNRRGPNDIWARVHDGAQWSNPSRITTAGLHHSTPAAVVLGEALWLFYCEDYDDDAKGTICRRLRCRRKAGDGEWKELTEAEFPVQKEEGESPCAVVLDNKIWLFRHTRDENGHWHLLYSVFDGMNWDKTQLVFLPHPAADKEPSAMVETTAAGKQSLRLFWRSQRRGHFRMPGQALGGGYPYLSCTVDTRNTEMLAHIRLGKASFENRVHCTFDTRIVNPKNEKDSMEAWCAREAVGVYLRADTFDAKLITQARELVAGLIQRFIPIQTRLVFVIESLAKEKVYTYDFPKDSPKIEIGETYEVSRREGIEQYDGLVESYQDTLPDWIWLHAWSDVYFDHRTATYNTVISTRYRTWETGLISGGDYMEKIGAALRGMYRDKIYDGDNMLVHDSGWKSNTIVVKCRELLACMMKGTGASGISGMKLGPGDPNWDKLPVPPPADDPNLDVVNAYPLPPFNPANDIKFLDGNDRETEQPTRRLQIMVVLPADFPEKGKTSDLREFGLFGNNGQNMINCVRHPVIQKTAAETLVRTVWLYF